MIRNDCAKELFLVSRTYSEYEFTNDSGDYDEEHDWVFEDIRMNASEVLRELSDCFELSCSHVTPDNCQHVWACTEGHTDMHTGIVRDEAIHIKDLRGRDLSSRRLFALYHAAGLAKLPINGRSQI